MSNSGAFSVESDSLVAAAGGIRAIVDTIDQRWVGLVMSGPGAFGHDALETAVNEFSSRWATELERIVGDQEGVADQLVAMVEMFLDTDIGVADALRNEATSLDHEW